MQLLWLRLLIRRCNQRGSGPSLFGRKQMRYRIVRRANSEYTTVETLPWGYGYVRALLIAEIWLEQTNHDGEYLVRGDDEPDQKSTSSYQSGMDWL